MTTRPEAAMTREQVLDADLLLRQIACHEISLHDTFNLAKNYVAKYPTALRRYAGDGGVTDEMVDAAIKQFEAKRQQCWCPECIRAGMRATLEAAARASGEKD